MLLWRKGAEVPLPSRYGCRSCPMNGPEMKWPGLASIIKDVKKCEEQPRPSPRLRSGDLPPYPQPCLLPSLPSLLATGSSFIVVLQPRCTHVCPLPLPAPDSQFFTISWLKYHSRKSSLSGQISSYRSPGSLCFCCQLWW